MFFCENSGSSYIKDDRSTGPQATTEDRIVFREPHTTRDIVTMTREHAELAQQGPCYNLDYSRGRQTRFLGLPYALAGPGSPECGAAPADIPEPFRGNTIADRHTTEPAPVYTPGERRLLCPVCGVPEIHRLTHSRGALHQHRVSGPVIQATNAASATS